MNPTSLEISVPLLIYQLEALLRRLNHHHPYRSYIESDLAKIRAGHRGEVSTSYFLKMLPEKSFTILHGLRLPTSRSKKYFFQMDFLLITSQFYVILEVKNLKGILQFDPDFDQLIRIHDSNKEGFSCPINQVQTQSTHFSKWLERYNLPALPVYPLVVISHPSSIIEVISNFELVKRKVLHAHGIQKKLHAIELTHDCSGSVPLKPQEIHLLAKKLLENNSPKKDQLLDKYSLSMKDLIRGIKCTYCQAPSVVNHSSHNWYCQRCRREHTMGYREALYDFKLIFGTEVELNELKQFLAIKCRHKVRRILLKEGGLFSNRSGRYILPSIFGK